MSNIYDWVSLTIFMYSVFCVVAMLGEVLFIVICSTAIDYFESAYVNPIYEIINDMVWSEIVNKSKLNIDCER